MDVPPDIIDSREHVVGHHADAIAYNNLLSRIVWFWRTTILENNFLEPRINAASSYTEAVDIYSLAITLWEIWTGEEPFAKFNQFQIYTLVGVEGVRPAVPLGMNEVLSECISAAWDQDAKARPSAAKLLNKLQREYDRLTAIEQKDNSGNSLCSSNDSQNSKDFSFSSASERKLDIRISTIEAEEDEKRRSNFNNKKSTFFGRKMLSTISSKVFGFESAANMARQETLRELPEGDGGRDSRGTASTVELTASKPVFLRSSKERASRTSNNAGPSLGDIADAIPAPKTIDGKDLKKGGEHEFGEDIGHVVVDINEDNIRIPNPVFATPPSGTDVVNPISCSPSSPKAGGKRIE